MPELDNPIIRNMERTGYPDGKEPQYSICPICGEECDTLYRNKYLDIVGCEECVTTIAACDYDN